MERAEKREEHESVKIFGIDQVLTTAVHASSVSKAEEDRWLTDLNLFHKHHRHDIILALLLPALLKVEKLDITMSPHLSLLRIGLDTDYLERMIDRKSSLQGENVRYSATI